MGWNPFKDSWFGRSSAKRSQKKATESADKSYELQKDMFDWQKKQLDILEAGKESKEAKEAAKIERQLQVKRQGRSSTLKTVEMKQKYSDFKAKQELSMDAPPEEPVAPKRPELKEQSPAGPIFPSAIVDPIGAKDQLREETSAYDVKFKNWQDQMAAREAKIQAAYGKKAAFTRKNLGTAGVKKRTLNA